MKERNVIVIDAQEDSRELIRNYLRSDIKAYLCENGFEGFEILRNELSSTDVIVLDMELPDNESFSIIHEIKNDKFTRNIPVIAIVSSKDTETEIKVLKSGAMDVMHRPLVPELVQCQIDRILEIKDVNLRLEGQVIDKTRELEALSVYTNEIQMMARKDALTGIYNRAYFEDMATTYIKRVKRGCIYMIDMDDFKSINDKYGHLAGDETLKKFAEIISDNINGRGIIGRIGGDEFIALLEDCDDKDKMAEIAMNIINDIGECEFHFDKNLRISASIGISVMPDNGIEFKELYNKADKALYYVKQNGKTQFHFYSDDNVNQDLNTSIQADLDAIKRIIGERHESNGAYLVEYDGFKKIYHFLERVVERTKEDFQIMLFTITNKNGEILNVNELEEAMTIMEKVISNYLRRGDVATNYSSCQYIVILTGAGEVEAVSVAERIKNVFNKKMGNRNIEVKFDSREITDISVRKEN